MVPGVVNPVNLKNPSGSSRSAENPTMHASREVVVDATSTVAETVASIRAAADRVSEVGRVWVSTGGAISGYVGASELLLAAPDHGIAGLAQPTETVLRDDESLDDALSRVVMLGGSGALPVVDGDGALVGALTPSEIMVELERDATEDVSRMAGTGTTESYFGAKIRDLVVSRGAWLLALLVLQSGSSVVLRTAFTIACIIGLGFQPSSRARPEKRWR